MLDDFFVRALIAGIGVALVTGPLGCFVVWRRLSYFGDTLSHSALLGVTMAYSFELNIALSVFIISDPTPSCLSTWVGCYIFLSSTNFGRMVCFASLEVI
mgnify:CR=1 FL=1